MNMVCIFLEWPNRPVLMFGLTLLILLSPYVLSPFALYRRVSRPLHAGWIAFESDDLRPRFPTTQFSNLEQMGFSCVGYLVKVSPQSAGVMFLAMFTHPQNKDSAELFFLSNGNTLLDLPVFKSRFDDGLAFEVGNSADAPHTISGGPQFPAFNFPQVHSTAELYQIHRKLKDQLSTTRRPVIAGGKGELVEFARKAEEVHQFSMSRGDHKLNASGDRYVYTILGAIRAAWRHQWPIAPLGRICALSKAKKHTRELGIASS